MDENLRNAKRFFTAVLALSIAASLSAGAADFGPSNPFYAASSLPFSAPPFDKIRDEDYQPAIEAGMAQQLAEIRKIADNPAPASFENTLVALERSGRLLSRAVAAFNGVSEANTNPVLQQAKTALAPEFAAHEDAMRLNRKLFERVAAVYHKRASLKLDPESLRLLEREYDQFVHSGGNLLEHDKETLKELNKESSSLSADLSKRLLAAAKAAAYLTDDKAALSGLSDAQLAAAAQAAGGRNANGYLVPLQNTTQQPVLKSLSVRATRESIFNNSWNRAERGDANGYYAYLWTQMLSDDAYQWFDDHGGMTRANGDRFRSMVLSRGNTKDLSAMYVAWRGKAPTIEAMMKNRGLTAP
jgi:peptidyl-dipeptidase Dcp